MDKYNIDFGDYVMIKQKRHGVENEMYLHKVVNGNISSNSFVDVPVQTPAKNTIHEKMEDCVSCICCGVEEIKVLKYRLCDVQKVVRS